MVDLERNAERFDANDAVLTFAQAMAAAGWEIDWQERTTRHVSWLNYQLGMTIEIKVRPSGAHLISGPGFSLTLEPDMHPSVVTLLVEALMGGLR